MNKYLLLRDNKQSGPYSVNDLAKHGLKPYDLVWLEGKSAAWRYPSEIEELKPFAPAVEEQPFDRFFKKAETKIDDPIAKDHTIVKKNPIFIKEDDKLPSPDKPAEQVREVKFSAAKKIHVSLPGGNAATLAVTSSAPKEEAKVKEEAKQKEEAKSKDQPAGEWSTVVHPIPSVQSGHYPTEAKTIAAPANTGSDKEHKRSQQKDRHQKAGSGHEPATVSKFLFRSVAAACLLLGGALIGLIINYNSQQKKFQQLNQLVQEIRHQDNKVSSVPVKKGTEDVELEETTQEPAAYKEDIQIPENNIETKSVKPKEPVNPGAAADTQVSEQEAPPVVVQPEEPSPKEKISPELARRNLWQLVSVDHNKYKTGVFGGISNLELKVSNKSLYQLEQVEVEIKYMGPEKKIVNTQTVIFENVAPGEQISLQVPKSSRGVQIDYSIRKINTKELGLAHAGM